MLPSKREDHRAALNLNARTPGLIGEDSDAVRERPAVCAHAVSIAERRHRRCCPPGPAGTHTAQTSTTAGTPSVPVRHGGRRPQVTSAAAAPAPSPRRTRILASSIERRRTILDLGILVPAGSFQWQANNNAGASSRRMPGQGHTHCPFNWSHGDPTATSPPLRQRGTEFICHSWAQQHPISLRDEHTVAYTQIHPLWAAETRYRTKRVGARNGGSAGALPDLLRRSA